MQYYVRIRGKTFGPFYRDQLLDLKNKGKITSASEISDDKIEWRLAAEYDFLFAKDASPNPTIPSMEQPEWFYSVNGIEGYGPLTTLDMVRMIQSGKLNGESYIWKQGENARYLQTIPTFSAFLGSEPQKIPPRLQSPPVSSPPAPSYTLPPPPAPAYTAPSSFAPSHTVSPSTPPSYSAPPSAASPFTAPLPAASTYGVASPADPFQSGTSGVLCPNCGGQIDSSAVICPRCGTIVMHSQAQTAFTQPNQYTPPTQSKPRRSAASSSGTGYFDVLKKYAVFRGRATRKEFWTFQLINIFICLILVIAMVIATIDAGISCDEDPSQPMPTIVIFLNLCYYLFSFAVTLPTWAVSVRRLHDAGYSGWLIFTTFIPFAGLFIMFFFLVQDSQPGRNQYGPNPKGY